MGLITAGNHHRNKTDKKLILNRLAFKNNTTIVGGASKLLKALCDYAKENGYHKIISWSDNRWSEGNVYNKIGFSLAKNLRYDYSYVNKDKRISKQSCQKKKLIKLGAIGKTEHEMALSLKLYRIYDCGKKRWELLI